MLCAMFHSGLSCMEPNDGTSFEMRFHWLLGKILCIRLPSGVHSKGPGLKMSDNPV